MAVLVRGSDSYGNSFNDKGGQMAVILDIAERAAAALPPHISAVELTSGNRGSGANHNGHAIDVQLYDAQGQPIYNYGVTGDRNPFGVGTKENVAAAYPYYAAWAQTFDAVQRSSYPEMTGKVGYGIEFGPTPSNKTGLDMMHIDLNGRRGTMADISKGVAVPNAALFAQVPGLRASLDAWKSGAPLPAGGTGYNSKSADKVVAAIAAQQGSSMMSYNPPSADLVTAKGSPWEAFFGYGIEPTPEPQWGGLLGLPAEFGSADEWTDVSAPPAGDAALNNWDAGDLNSALHQPLGMALPGQWGGADDFRAADVPMSYAPTPREKPDIAPAVASRAAPAPSLAEQAANAGQGISGFFSRSLAALPNDIKTEVYKQALVADPEQGHRTDQGKLQYFAGIAGNGRDRANEIGAGVGGGLLNAFGAIGGLGRDTAMEAVGVGRDALSGLTQPAMDVAGAFGNAFSGLGSQLAGLWGQPGIPTGGYDRNDGRLSSGFYNDGSMPADPAAYAYRDIAPASGATAFDQNFIGAQSGFSGSASTDYDLPYEAWSALGPATSFTGGTSNNRGDGAWSYSAPSSPFDSLNNWDELAYSGSAPAVDLGAPSAQYDDPGEEDDTETAVTSYAPTGGGLPGGLGLPGASSAPATAGSGINAFAIGMPGSGFNVPGSIFSTSAPPTTAVTTTGRTNAAPASTGNPVTTAAPARTASAAPYVAPYVAPAIAGWGGNVGAGVGNVFAASVPDWVGGLPYSGLAYSAPSFDPVSGGSEYGYAIGQDAGGNDWTSYQSHGGDVFSFPTDIPAGMSYSEYGPSAGDAGDSGGSTVLCTHYKRKGWLATRVWAADMRFSASLPSEVYRGYLAWALPCLNVIERGGWRGWLAERALWLPVSQWARYAAYRQGIRRQPIIGTLLHWGGVPICRAVGRRVLKRAASAALSI